MNPAEMTALVDFLVSLRPDGRRPRPHGHRSRAAEIRPAMNPTLDACVRSWPCEPWLAVALVVTAALYCAAGAACTVAIHSAGRAANCSRSGGGLAVIYLALASPIEPFSSFLLSVHMMQHVLLMMAAPPLVWLGAPLFPLLRGVPRPIRANWFAPLFRSRAIRRGFAAVAHPVVALPLYTAANLAVARAGAYDLALRSAGWHYVQHLCFLATALAFWYPVIRPYPAGRRGRRGCCFPICSLPTCRIRCSRRLVDILPPSALSATTWKCPGRRAFGPARSSDRRRDHVGARIGRVSRSTLLDRCAVVVRQATNDAPLLAGCRM